MDEHILMLCRHFQREAESLCLEQQHPHVRFLFFQGRCGDRSIPFAELRERFGPEGDPSSMDVLSGGCISELPTPEAATDCHPSTCFGLLLNPELVQQFMSQGYHLLTPGWLEHWETYVEHWGFTEEALSEFFAEFSRGLLLLDTGVYPKAREHLAGFAERVELPFRTLEVGTTYFARYLKARILRRDIQELHTEKEHLVLEKQRELSQYAMGIDFMSRLAAGGHEEEILDRMKEMFTLLFAPNQIRYVPQGESCPPIDERDGFELPIAYDGSLIGTLQFEDLMFPKYRRQYINLATGLADVCGLAISNARQHERLEQMAHTDALTRIANRRRFDRYLERSFQRLRRPQAPLSLLLCDIDHFKAFNDHYGHTFGDACLALIAQTLSAACSRSDDLVARYGGEEFAVILPQTDHVGAHKVAERMRAAVENLRIPHAASPKVPYVTISIGTTTRVPTADTSPAQLIEEADQALYRAKAAGRNRSISFDSAD